MPKKLKLNYVHPLPIDGDKAYLNLARRRA